MNDLNDLIARLCLLPPVAVDRLAHWRVVVDHPWMLAQFNRVAHLVTRTSRPPVSAEDLVQQAITDLSRRDLTGLDLTRPYTEIGAYLRQLVGWEVRGAARRAWGENCGRPLESAVEPSTGPDASADLWELIERLPRVQKRIVKLRIEGYTWKEISRKMRKPLATSYGHYRRACRTLEAALRG